MGIRARGRRPTLDVVPVPPAKRVEPRAKRVRGGRFQTSVRVHPDLFCDIVKAADEMNVSLGHLMQIATARFLHARGMPQSAENMMIPHQDDDA